MKLVVILVVFISIACALSSNLYQACTNGGSSISYGTVSSNYYDFGRGTLPHDQSYSLFNSTTGETLYFNLCAGIEVCQGAMACVKDKTGFVQTFTYPFYPSTQLTYGYLQYYYGQKDLYIQLSCGTSPMSIFSYEVYYNELNIYAYSTYGCSISGNVATYVAPQYYSSFSSPIYMKGRITYFLQDYLAGGFNSEFVGNIYYSTSYGLVVNGTLSTGTDSHFVSFIYEKQIPFNPPRAVAYIQTSPGVYECLIQATGDNYDDYFAEDIFSVNYNEWQSVQRQYTSLHYSAGTKFTVNTYTDSPYNLGINLMTRVSDGKVVSISPSLISPWSNNYSSNVGEFVTEVDWTNISPTTLEKNSFTVPNTWDCGF